MLHLGFSRDFTRKITTSVERLYPKSRVLRTDDVIGCRNVTTYMVCNHVDVIGYYACTNAPTHTHTHTHSHTHTHTTIQGKVILKSLSYANWYCLYINDFVMAGLFRLSWLGDEYIHVARL